MKWLVGLGNPGPEYKLTRHNSGAMLMDKLAETEKGKSDYGWRKRKNIVVWESPKVTLVKSAGIFMNESGRMLLDSGFRIQDSRMWYVAHDDLDIKLGEYKIQFGTGPKVHGGVNSIEETLKTDQFWRIRIGVDNRGLPRMPGEEYVLQRFSGEEIIVLNGVLDKIIEEIKLNLNN